MKHGVDCNGIACLAFIKHKHTSSTQVLYRALVKPALSCKRGINELD